MINLKKTIPLSIAILNADFTIKSLSSAFTELHQIEEIEGYFEKILPFSSYPSARDSFQNLDVYVLENPNISLPSHISFLDVFPNYQNTLLQSSIEFALNGKINHWEEKTQINGRTKYIKWSIYPKFDKKINEENNSNGIYNIKQIILICEDITQIKINLFSALQAKRISRIGFWKIDLIHDIVVWSDVTRQIHEVDEDYVPNLKDGINFYEEGQNRELITKHVQEAIKNGTSWDVDLKLVTAKNNKIWIKAKGEARFENGKCIGLSGTFQDISLQVEKLHHLETLLQDTNNQNDRLTNFAHIVSHNLRSSVNNMAMLTSFLETEKDEAQKEILINHISSSISKLKITVSDLNELVTIQNHEIPLEKINLYQTTDNVIASIHALINSNEVTILNEIDSKLTIKAIPAYLQSILLNFLTNSIKYKSKERNSIVKLKSTLEQNKVILAIQDNGLGIDLKLYGSKLFGMYKTFHEHEDSRGIGLFITRTQIEALGGKVSVESEVNVGTTFYIEFLI